MVAHFSIEKWHMFHFDVLFSNGSRGDFFDYKLVNIWLDKITCVTVHLGNDICVLKMRGKSGLARFGLPASVAKSEEDSFS